MVVLQTALEPGEHYYRLLKKYQSVERNINDMRKLALQCKSSDEKLAMQIAEEYVELINRDNPITKYDIQFMEKYFQSPVIKNRVKDYKLNHLDRLSGKELLKEDNLYFIARFPFLLNSKNKFFSLIYYDNKTVDSLLVIKEFSDKNCSRCDKKRRDRCYFVYSR